MIRLKIYQDEPSFVCAENPGKGVWSIHNHGQVFTRLDLGLVPMTDHVVIGIRIEAAADRLVEADLAPVHVINLETMVLQDEVAQVLQNEFMWLISHLIANGMSSKIYFAKKVCL